MLARAGCVVAPLLALAVTSACGAVQPLATKPSTIHPDLPPSSAPASPLMAARWIDSGGITQVGPTLATGTLVLLGGRRAIVEPSGAMRSETTPTPEPILEIIEAPTASGEKRLVGRGLHAVYRFGDPLGAPTVLAHSEIELTGMGAGPGLVALWDLESDLPRFLDLESGQPKTLAGLPEPPLRALAFRNAKEGAAIFHAAGLTITTDGGATWRAVTDTDVGDALRVTGVRLRGDTLRAFVYAEGKDAAIDLAQARLGPMEAPPSTKDEAPILRWIRTTGRDPLEAAVASGIDAPTGGALVASHGLLARIDLRTGAVIELAEFAHGGGMNACSVAKAGRAAWVACALSEDTDDDLYDPFGVLRVQLGGALVAEKPVLTRNGAAELRASPSGGVMIAGPCDADAEGDACVRQPDGKWVTVKAVSDLLERGVGPLSDGRIAFLRNLYDGDEEPDPQARPTKRDASSTRRPALVAIGPSGKEQQLGSITWASPPTGEIRIQSPIEEDADHALGFVLADDDGALAVVHPPGRDAPPPQRIPGAAQARLHGGRGIAVGEGRVSTSLDGGVSWTDVPVPGRLKSSAARLGHALEEPGALALSDVGAKIDTHLRVGWGPPDPIPEEPRPAPGTVLLPRPAPVSTGVERILTCTSAGAAQATPPLTGSNQIRALLGTKEPPPKGTKREVSSAFSGRGGVLETIAVLEEEGPDKPGAAPTKWTLRWHDPREVGGSLRQWSGPPPKAAGWGASLRTAASQGARGLFAFRIGGKYLLLRVRPQGGVEVAEMAFDLLPTADAVFGGDRGEPIAWLHETLLVVWLAGETPRVLGTLSGSTLRWLGEPAKDGITVVVGGNDWALMRTFPITAASKTETKPKPAPPSLTGWTRVDNVRRDVGRLAACPAASKGVRVLLPRTAAAVNVDGVDAPSQSAVYELRVTPTEACVASIAALVAPDRRPTPSAAPPRPSKPAAPAKPTPASPGGVSFVRADLQGKRADGGERGLGGPNAVRKLSCALTAKP